MRCNPSLWLLGIVPVAMLSWLAVQNEHEGIERDLARRTENALHHVGLDWATVRFHGRDGVLRGKATEDGARERALAFMRNTWGVRLAYDRTGLVPRVGKFVWSAKFDSGSGVTLLGYVPSESARKSLVANARRAFRGARVSDRMHLARGAVDRDEWLEAANFSLKNLAQLKRGEAELSALDLSISGEAPSSGVYRHVRAELSTKRPRGLNLARQRITLPVAHPFTWSASKSGDLVSITGFAPSDEDRSAIAARARKAFAKSRISDGSDIAAGAPEAWSEAVSVSLDQLAHLKSGEIKLSDMHLAFSGEAVDEQTASAVRRTLKLDVPRNFKIVDRIRYPRQPFPNPADGYVMGLVSDGVAVKVTGMIPSEAARMALIDAVKARFPGRPVRDATKVVSGAPEGWQQCVVAGLASLSKLKTGKSILTDHKLAVSGETDDYAASQSVPGDVKAASGEACETTADIKFTGQMKTELTWSALRQANGMVTLSGEAPDKASRQRLVEVARQIYAGASVTDDMHVAGAAPEPWLSATRIALEQLARLHHGEVSLSAKEMTIKGAASSEKVASDVRGVLSTELPPGFSERDDIAVMTTDEKAADSCQVLMRQAAAQGTINFARAKADLTPDSTQTLKHLVEIANRCPRFSIEIEGHTDAEGTDERNQRLSDRRAQTVAEFLANNGVDEKRLSTIGYGATRPVADNATEGGRAKNRRIEFNVKLMTSADRR